MPGPAINQSLAVLSTLIFFFLLLLGVLLVAGRFGPKPFRTLGRFGPESFRPGRSGLGRFGPILELGRFGQIGGSFQPIFFFSAQIFFSAPFFFLTLHN